MSLSYWQANYNNRTEADVPDDWLSAHAREIFPGSAVLDLGCGMGTNLPALLQLGAKVCAGDFSKKAIAALQDRFSDLVRADCFDMRAGLPYADGCFDAVIADLSLHYFSWQDTCFILSEIRRTLKTGGYLLARMHSMENLSEIPAEQIEEHYYLRYGCARRYFTEEEICDLLADWKLEGLCKQQIHRYERIKHIYKIVAAKR